MLKKYKLCVPILCALLIICGNLYAQIPNPGFENWTTQGFPQYSNPDGWATVNSSTAIISTFTAEKVTGADAHSGTAAIRLTSKSLFGRLAPGTAVTGTINTNTEQTGDGFIYTQRPHFLTGWFKASPAQGDTNIIEVRLWKRIAGKDSIIGEATFLNKAAVSTYTKFRLPVTYLSPLSPDSCRLTLLSCSETGHANSVLFVDDLAFVTCNTTASVTTANTTFVDTNDGTATATLAGGAGPYTYVWSNAGSTATIGNLAEGNYCVTITDDNGCSASACNDVQKPSCFAMMASVAVSDATTHGGNEGSAEVFVAGGNSGFTYAWNTGAITKTISNLPTGNYCVTVTDNVHCTATACEIVDEPSCQLVVTVNTTNATTAGGNEGSAIAIAAAVNPPLTFLWNNSASSDTITGLTAGNYCVTVTDNVNCSVSACGQVTSPSCGGFLVGLTATAATTVGGSDGTVTSTIAGGNGPYSYLWNTGDTTANLNGVVAGAYCLTVTDANGCPATDCGTVSQPGCAGFGVSFVTTDVATVGGTNGSINATVAGGSAPYAYLWSNNAITEDLVNIGPGIYCLTVTDVTNCTVAKCDTVAQPSCAGFSVSVAHTNATTVGGSNGSVTATVTGGVAQYHYNWSNGDSMQALPNLPAGAYCLTVTDAANCTASDCDTVGQPSCAGFSVTVSHVNASSPTSATGSATANVTGGASPFIYVWNSPANSPTIGNLPPGTYCVTASDAANCTASACDSVSFNVGIVENAFADFNLYPNPTKDAVTIQTNSYLVYQLSLYTTDGKQVMDRRLTEPVTVIHLNRLPAGLYLYKLTETESQDSYYGRIKLVK